MRLLRDDAPPHVRCARGWDRAWCDRGKVLRTRRPRCAAYYGEVVAAECALCIYSAGFSAGVQLKDGDAWKLLRASVVLSDIYEAGALSVAADLVGSSYVALHLRRGDKKHTMEKYGLTVPAVLDRVSLIARGRSVIVATDDRSPCHCRVSKRGFRMADRTTLTRHAIPSDLSLGVPGGPADLRERRRLGRHDDGRPSPSRPRLSRSPRKGRGGTSRPRHPDAAPPSITVAPAFAPNIAPIHRSASETHPRLSDEKAQRVAVRFRLFDEQPAHLRRRSHKNAELRDRLGVQRNALAPHLLEPLVSQDDAARVDRGAEDAELGHRPHADGLGRPWPLPPLCVQGRGPGRREGARTSKE